MDHSVMRADPFMPFGVAHLSCIEIDSGQTEGDFLPVGERFFVSHGFPHIQ